MLCLWFPFNGDTKNYGLIDGNFTVTDATFCTGKIGKCLNTGSISMDAKTTAKILNNDAVSMAFWIYVNADTGNTTNKTIIFGNNGMAANNNRKFSLFQYPTCNDLHLSWQNDEKDTTFTTQVLTGVLPSYQWTHVVVTYKNPNGYIYINGKLVKTFSGISDSSSFEYTTQIIHNSPYLYFNDYRIYNHCLSPLEISLLSQSMVCHITMGNVDGKIGGRNLILNGKGDKKAGFFKGFPTVTDEYGEVTLKSKKKYSSINIADGFLLGCRDYTVGEQVTWSYDIMYTAWNFPTGTNRNEFWMGQRYTITPSGQTGTGNWRIVTRHDLPAVGVNGCELNKWHHVEVTMTIPEQASSNVGTASSIQFYNSNPDVEASFTARFKNVKLERGNIATDWTPSPEDNSSLYDNTIYDTSGYCNNGTITDSTCPSWSSDSPRYRGCYYFKNKQYLTVENPFGTGNRTELTISVWVNQVSGGAYSTILSMNGYGAGGIWMGVNVEKFGQWMFIGGNSPNYYRVGNVSKNTWNMFTFIFNNGEAYWYLNGERTGNKVTYTNKYISLTDIFTIGDSYVGSSWDTNFEGYLSDFRIYATALSSDDVKELYDSVTSISNTGVLVTHEFVEEEI